jgi:hypothetical protein
LYFLLDPQGHGSLRPTLLAGVETDDRGVWMRIPTQSGQGFRFDVGHRSDLIPATIPK